MLTRLLKAKIHRATVTMTDVNYHGSITIDSDLLKATGLLPNEAVIVADCDNGARFETYVIPGQSGSGIIGINGAAARLSKIGHKVIVMSFVCGTSGIGQQFTFSLVPCGQFPEVTLNGNTSRVL